jgi:hypothetical protein
MSPKSTRLVAITRGFDFGVSGVRMAYKEMALMRQNGAGYFVAGVPQWEVGFWRRERGRPNAGKNDRGF